jgi:hypothetical protein
MMQQFQMTRHYQSKIEAIYMFGDYNGFDKLIVDLSQSLPMAIEVMPAIDNLQAPEDFNYLSYIHILGSLAGNPKNLNFDKLYSDYLKQEKAMNPTKKKFLILGGVSVLVLGGIYGGLFYYNDQIKNQIAIEQNYTTNVETIEKVTKVLEDESIISAYKTIVNEITNAQANLNIIPTINSYTVQVIFGYEGISINGMSSDLGIFTIDISAADPHTPTYYADYLKNSGIFESVVFNQIGINEQSGDYNFAVIATMGRGE